MINNDGKQYQIKSTELIWTTAMDARLKHLKDTKTQICHIAHAFGCSKGIIHRRLRVLNLTENRWTTAQDRKLKQNYLTMTNKELARLLRVNEIYIGDRLAYRRLLRPRGRKSKLKTVSK